MNDKTPSGEKPRQDTPVINRANPPHPGQTANSLVEGQLVGGRFKVLFLLGKGGMGSVYLVEELSTGKRYALKTILGTAASESNRKRFLLEAKATSLLIHPNLVRLHEFGSIDDAQPFFLMDYCDGHSLRPTSQDRGADGADAGARFVHHNLSSTGLCTFATSSAP